MRFLLIKSNFNSLDSAVKPVKLYGLEKYRNPKDIGKNAFRTPMSLYKHYYSPI